MIRVLLHLVEYNVPTYKFTTQPVASKIYLIKTILARGLLPGNNKQMKPTLITLFYNIIDKYNNTQARLFLYYKLFVIIIFLLLYREKQCLRLVGKFSFLMLVLIKGLEPYKNHNFPTSSEIHYFVLCDISSALNKLCMLTEISLLCQIMSTFITKKKIINQLVTNKMGNSN